MTETISLSAVVVYSSSSVVDTQIVRGMLEAEGIHATATEVNEPFTGLPIATSEVVVWREDEDRARALIQQTESRHNKRTKLEEQSCCGAGRR